MNHNKSTKPEVLSYLMLRRSVGIIGMALPVILVVGSVIVCDCCDIQVSISNYYHTCMRNVFVGLLCSVGLFMFSYKGYDIRDNIAGHLAAIFAFGVAWLPTNFKGDSSCLIHPVNENPLTGYLHLASALLFFSVLIYFSLCLFTKSASDVDKTPRKKTRNRVYRICGYTMMACLIIIIIYIGFFRGEYPKFDKINLVFWLESLSLWAFGISWLVKGEVLLKD